MKRALILFSVALLTAGVADAGILRGSAKVVRHTPSAAKHVAKGAGKVVAGTAKVAYKVVY